MNWTIRVKPINSTLNMWSWTAVRDDQESTLSGAGYETSEEALSAAKVDADAFEAGQGVIRDATFEVVYDPGAEQPAPEPEPEVPAP